MSDLQGPWPEARTRSEWDALRRADTRLAPVVDAILDRHGPREARRRFETGSLPVYAVGETRVLKLFAPFETDFHRTEVAALTAVEGRLRIPTPRVLAAETLRGWPYVLMSRCPGTPLCEVWPRLSMEQRGGLMVELGGAIADLHAVVPPRILASDWARFTAEQVATAVSRQRARGLDESWCGQIEAFVRRAPLDDPTSPVLLHTEVMQEHLLVVPDRNGWAFTGLVDFEPAMVGAAGYELASVGLFVTEGDPRLLRAFVDAYGGCEIQGAPLARRCLAYALLHRYSNLPWYLDRLPIPAEVTTLDALAELWFGT